MYAVRSFSTARRPAAGAAFLWGGIPGGGTRRRAVCEPSPGAAPRRAAGAGGGATGPAGRGDAPAINSSASNVRRGRRLSAPATPFTPQNPPAPPSTPPFTPSPAVRTASRPAGATPGWVPYPLPRLEQVSESRGAGPGVRGWRCGPSRVRSPHTGYPAPQRRRAVVNFAFNRQGNRLLVYTIVIMCSPRSRIFRFSGPGNALSFYFRGKPRFPLDKFLQR